MHEDLVQRIAGPSKYQELKAKRTRFGWSLTATMMVVYYGFVLLVAFDKPFLAKRVGQGVMTMGIPIGFGVIVFTIVITADYVQARKRRIRRVDRSRCQRRRWDDPLARPPPGCARSRRCRRCSAGVWAAGADLGQARKQPTNWTAIGMFGRVRRRHAVRHQVGCGEDQVGQEDFYTAGGGIAGSRTGWRSLATTCPRRRSSASRRR